MPTFVAVSSPRLAQRLQVVRDGRLGEREVIDEVTDTRGAGLGA